MNIYEIQSEFALLLKEHDTANGERIPNTSVSISIELVEAVHELLNEAIVQGLGQDPALRSPEAERDSTKREWELHSNWVIQVREWQRGNKPPLTKEVA